jgi:hypothetical protein
MRPALRIAISYRVTSRHRLLFAQGRLDVLRKLHPARNRDPQNTKLLAVGPVLRSSLCDLGIATAVNSRPPGKASPDGNRPSADHQADARRRMRRVATISLFHGRLLHHRRCRIGRCFPYVTTHAMRSDAERRRIARLRPAKRSREAFAAIMRRCVFAEGASYIRFQ